MKKVSLTKVLILITVGSFLFPLEMLADASNTIRSGCSLFNKRYRSEARTKGNDFWDLFACKDKDSDCNDTWAQCTSYDNGGFPDWCAVANAAVFPGGFEQIIEDTNRGCTAGMGINDLSKALDARKLTGSTKTKLTYYRNIDVFNRTYQIKQVSGILVADKNYPALIEIKFIMWLAKDDHKNKVEDTEITDDKILNQEYIRVVNNHVEISEGLRKNSSIQVEETPNEIIIKIVNLEYEYRISDDVDIDKEFAGTVGVFSEFDEKRFLENQLLKSEGNYSFDVYPNPAQEQFTIKLENKELSIDKHLEVQLFNSTGKYVRTIFSGINEGQDIIVSEIRNLDSGTYFIVVKQNGIIETKEITIIE